MADVLAAKLQAIQRGRQTRRQVLNTNDSGNAIRVRIRVRPLGEGRGRACDKLQIDTARGIITVLPTTFDHGATNQQQSTPFALPSHIIQR